MPGIGYNLSPPLRLSFLLAAAAHKVALFVRSIAAPLTSKCYKVEGRQATAEVQSDEVIQAKQALNTQSTATTDCACKCSINLVLHLSGVTEDTTSGHQLEALSKRHETLCGRLKAEKLHLTPSFLV